MIHLLCRKCKFSFGNKGHKFTPTCIILHILVLTQKTGADLCPRPFWPYFFSAAAAVAATTAATAAVAAPVAAIIVAAAAEQDDDQNDDPQTTAAIVIPAPHIEYLPQL